MNNNVIILIVVALCCFCMIISSAVGGYFWYDSQQQAEVAKTTTVAPTTDTKVTPTTDTKVTPTTDTKTTTDNKTTTVTITPVDCVVSDWSKCSKDCGTGKQSRTITTPKVGTGKDCPVLEQDCNTQACPPTDVCGTDPTATNLSDECINKLWDEAKCEVKPSIHLRGNADSKAWAKARTKQELVNDYGLWSSLTTPWHQVGCHGKDKNFYSVGFDANVYYRNDMVKDEWKKADASCCVIDVCKLKDGKLLGVGYDNLLWTKENVNAGWVQVPNSGSVIRVIQMNDGKILGIGMDYKLYTRDTLTSQWVYVNDNSCCVTGIAQMKDGTIIGVGFDYALWQRANLTAGWVSVPGTCCITDVRTDENDRIIGIGFDNFLYYRNNLNDAWKKIDNSCCVHKPTLAYPGSNLIKQAWTNKCVDDKGAGSANGMQMHYWDCDGGNNNQKFNWDPATKQLKDLRTGRCLDDNGATPADGMVPHQWDCDVNNVNQRFIYANGQFKGERTGLCLSTPGDQNVKANNATAVVLRNCDITAPAQKFMAHKLW